VLSQAELRRVVRVLAPRITGHRVQDVTQPDELHVVLTSYGPAEEKAERRCFVLLSCHPSAARLSCVARAPAAPPSPPAFAQYLRAHALGARIAGLRLDGEDRIAALELETKEGPATLLLSLFGRRSNAYWLDAEGRVAATLRPLESTRPELVRGEPWRPPASRPPPPGADRFEAEPDAGLFAAVEAVYAPLEREEDRAGLARRVEQALRKEARRLDRKLGKIAAELAAARADSELGRQGELLKGALSQLRRGDREAEVRDHATGEQVRIALDPQLSPAENLERLFKRYRKAVRSLARGGAQEQAVRTARGEIDALAAQLAGVAASEAELRSFAEQPAVQRLLREGAPAAPRAPARPGEEREVRIAGRPVPRRLLPRRYATAGGLEIWVGRSDEANDLLTTRLARGKDLFFHLDGAPGSHVILRTEGRDDPPAEALLDACELAVHFSKLRDAPSADVHVVPIRNVRKPKGAKPGLVRVHGGKTVHLRRTPSRLERVLSARVD
jgi:predicted ribosome quality control (RQC) complex YloA/Tae2 family protein